MRMRVLLVFLVAGCAAYSPSRTTMSDRELLVGTWRLVQYQTWDSERRMETPFGDPASGYAVFDATGHAFVQLMRTPPTPPFASPNEPTTEEIRAAYSGFAAYYGKYTIDDISQTVTIHVEGSSMPSYVGTDQARPFRIEDDTLTLGVPNLYRATLARVR